LDPALLDHVDLAAQLDGELDPAGAGALKAAIGGGESTQGGAIGGGDRIEAAAALFGTGEDPGGVEFSSGAAAGGFAAAGAQQVEGAGDHGIGSLQAAQEASEETVIGPEALAKSGEGWRHIFME
jgi:hypothetical protein